MLRDLSLRYKIPLRGAVLILITSFAVTAALIFRAYDDLKQDLIANAQGLASVMAHSLIPAMLKDDVWGSYQIVRAPFTVAPAEHPALRADAILVVNGALEVYAASHPQAFRMLSPVGAAGPDFAVLQRYLAESGAGALRVLDLPRTESLFVVTPIVSDQVPLGLLIMSYRRDGFTPRFARLVGRAGVATLVVIAALLPLSWYWGARLAEPLVKLAGCLGRIGREPPAQLDCRLLESRDEIGQLGTGFRQMLRELKAKQDLERQVIAAERLAAVGRLTASIAHEINNPLGGMLNAISTQRRYGQLDALGEKTFSLLERGLIQVRDTVSALLVETRATQRHFGPDDAEDVRTLVTPDIQRQHARLEWEAEIEPVPLPATPIRQVLINLLLNAAKAVPPEGRVGCRIRAEAGALDLCVTNDGEPIPEEHMPHLFEPFVHDRPDGNGLGLWVCYQIVSQLGGRIGATSDAGGTRFAIQIPLPA